jgi:predicted nucleotidyltransferase
MGTQARTDDLLAALFGRIRCRVLALFFSRPEQAFYLREVVRQVGGGVGAVQRELRRLTGAGILLREVRGRQVYYQANRSCPVAEELRWLILKTAGAAEVLRAALAGLADRIETAFVYGSLARDSAKAGSDVDVMIVGAVAFAEVVAALASAQEQLGREVNPSVYPLAEFHRKLAEGHHFLTTVLREPKVFLLGGEHELARLAEKRLVDGASDQPARGRRPARRRRP